MENEARTADRPEPRERVQDVLAEVRLVLQPGNAPPQAAVIYVGSLLTLPRKIWQGQTPITHGRRQRVVNGVSESGQFLGRIITTSWRETKVDLLLIDPDTYRSDIDPFLEAAQENPFFFAWRPVRYPDEVGYCWLINEPEPVNEGPSGLVALELHLQGIAP